MEGEGPGGRGEAAGSHQWPPALGESSWSSDDETWFLVSFWNHAGGQIHSSCKPIRTRGRRSPFSAGQGTAGPASSAAALGGSPGRRRVCPCEGEAGRPMGPDCSAGSHCQSRKLDGGLRGEGAPSGTPPPPSNPSPASCGRCLFLRKGLRGSRSLPRCLNENPSPSEPHRWGSAPASSEIVLSVKSGGRCGLSTGAVWAKPP